MKSYLSLIPIAAKVHKRQNRMTILCIIISVLLVTVIFSVADMFIRTKSSEMLDSHGNWHFQIKGLSADIAQEISGRPDVKALGWKEVFNENADQPYYIGEKKATLYGTESIYMTQLMNTIEEGSFPQSDHEVMLSSNAKLALGVELGDSVALQAPAGSLDVTISGFGSDDKEYYQGQSYLVGVYMTQATFQALMQQNGISGSPDCYVQFDSASAAMRAMEKIRHQFGLAEESISENTAVMGLAGQSSNASVRNIYGIAAVLFVLVLLAGVLMISGSMNSNVAQRTRFFGMMRCIGASRQQVVRYVRLEALNWCKTAVPVGMVLGTAISWGICAMMRYGIGGEFSSMPVFAFSVVGLSSGAVVGMMTVLLAAQAPAKRAAKVSPMAAVSNNTESVHHARRTFIFGFGKIERRLGIHHATASRKNWFLMTASFSLSMILLLCFSVGLDFARQLLPSLRSWQPDLTLNGYANERVLSQSLMDTIRSIEGVDYTFGCAYMENVEAASSREGVGHVNLSGYSDSLLDIAKDSVSQGDISEIYGDSGKAMTVLNKDNPLKVGDTVQVAGIQIEITCAVSQGIYPSEYSVICSQETFARLTGEQNYSLIGVRLDKEATDETVRQASSLAEDNVIFSDERKRNQEDRATYLASVFVVYSFLGIIAIITIVNIVNSISMSVTARIKQYGAMRAVGMDGTQLTRMIAAEAFTYAISGLVIGCGAGVALSRFLHIKLVTRYFGISWSLPVLLLVMIAVFDIASAALAIYAPAKRLRSMAITDTINSL